MENAVSIVSVQNKLWIINVPLTSIESYLKLKNIYIKMKEQKSPWENAPWREREEALFLC